MMVVLSDDYLAGLLDALSECQLVALMVALMVDKKADLDLNSVGWKVSLKVPKTVLKMVHELVADWDVQLVRKMAGLKDF